MKSSLLSTRVAAISALLASLFFVAQWRLIATPLFTETLTAAHVEPFIALTKMIAQASGCYYAAKSAQHYRIGSAIRRAWTLVSAWLGCWFFGQLAFAIYTVFLHRPVPTPSPADLFFVAGFVLSLTALSTFTSVYRASGFSIASRLDSPWVTAGAATLFALVAFRILSPLMLAPLPLFDRTFAAVFPALDLTMLAAVCFVLRIALRFGGQVWRVWAAILAGLIFATGGDVLFAYTSIQNVIDVDALSNLAFTLAYILLAYGTRLQYELVAAE